MTLKQRLRSPLTIAVFLAVMMALNSRAAERVILDHATIVADSDRPSFVQYGVDLVFNGHDHDYERSVAKGVIYIVAGGGGAPLYTQVNSNPASVYFTSTYHSVLVTVTESLLSVTGVRSDGVAFDRFSLFKTEFYLPMVIKSSPVVQSRIELGARLPCPLRRPCSR